MNARLVCLTLLAMALAGQQTAATDALCTDILKRALAAKNPDTRMQAVVALSLANEKGALLPLLVAMADDKDVQVRVAVVASLGEVKTSVSREILHKLLKDTVPEVSFAAAKALWNLRDPAGKEALLSVMAGESKTNSPYLTAEMRQAMRMMHTPTTTLLFAVREGMAFVPVPGLGQGFASMQALLSDPSTSGRATAVLLIGKDKDPALLSALKDALHDSNWTVRAAAVHSLALRDDPNLKADLVPLLEDDKEGVRLRTAAAFLRLSAIRLPAQRKPAAK